MNLSELQIGEKAIILHVNGTGQFRKRILEMGFVHGKEVTAVHGAPMQDPIHYRILGYDVSLRRADAELIDIRRLTDEERLQGEDEVEDYSAKDTLNGLQPLGAEFLGRKGSKRLRIALVGNPNCGKTSLFNQASGAHEHVGNYSGVTVERKTGYIHFGDYRIELVDLPGAYSLSPYSPEEVYIRNYLTGDDRPDIVLNVIDTTNLERNLYLTVQVKELGLPVVVALNMFDEFTARKEYLDYPRLSRLMGIPMVPTVCRTGLGLQALFSEIIEVWEGIEAGSEELLNPENGKIRPLTIYYGNSIDGAIQTLTDKIIQHLKISSPQDARHIAIKLMERDKDIEMKLMNSYGKGAFIISARDYELKQLEEELDNADTEELMTDARYGYIAGALRETYKPKRKHQKSLTDKIDYWVTHRYLGFPLFLFLMFLMFEATFVLGAYPMDWIEAGVNWLGAFIGENMSEGPIKDLIVDGIISGVGGVIVFLPNILILYFFISIFEDTGYMARAAFIMDKIMHRMGLHGKSFIPLIMGFGCNVPAVMATRTIESRKSRIITMLVLPFMSCSARLPVYLLLAGALFAGQAGLVLFMLYIVGVGIAIISARVLRATHFKGEDIPFVMELPPYRMPTSKAIMRHMWSRAEQYLHKMGTTILLASIVIWFLSYFPRQGEAEARKDAAVALVEQRNDLSSEVKADSVAQLEHEFAQYHQSNSWIGRMGHGLSPIISPLGFDWKMGVSLLSGLGAKEVVVSTLGVIYTGDSSDGDEAKARLVDRIKADVRPDGSPSFTPLVGIAFMLFVLIYFPCTATIIAIGRESGSWKWSVFSIIYSCSLAWLVAFIVYQVGMHLL